VARLPADLLPQTALRTMYVPSSGRVWQVIASAGVAVLFVAKYEVRAAASTGYHAWFKTPLCLHDKSAAAGAGVAAADTHLY
jgi:hypothetical protein